MYLIKYTVRVLLIIGTAALLTVMCVTVANIFGRLIFQSPVMGAIELAGLCGAVVVSFSLFYTQLEKRNVSTSIVFNLLPKRLQKILDKLTFALSITIVGVMAYAAAMSAHESLSESEITAILTIPIWPFWIVWVAACVALFVVLIRQLMHSPSGVEDK